MTLYEIAVKATKYQPFRSRTWSWESPNAYFDYLGDMRWYGGNELVTLNRAYLKDSEYYLVDEPVCEGMPICTPDYDW